MKEYVSQRECCMLMYLNNIGITTYSIKYAIKISFVCFFTVYLLFRF